MWVLGTHSPPAPTYTTTTSSGRLRAWLLPGVVMVVDENVFIAGGFNGDSLSSVEYFSLTSLTWYTGPSLPISTTYARLIQLRGDLYFLGGRTDGGKTKAIYYLETSTGEPVSNLRWKLVGNLKKPKNSFAALPWVKTVCN